MISEQQLRVVERHVYEATARGAVALTGGERVPDVPGPFFPPTVLTNVNHGMEIMREETFGPVLPIMTFKTDDEAVRLANDSDFGLTASVWTNDLARGRALAERIDAGTVTVNEVLYTHAIAQTPWGGVKHSGFGRTHGRAGLLELVNAQHIHVNRFPSIPDVWWFSYTPDAGKLFRSLARRFASGSIFQMLLTLPQMIRRLNEIRTRTVTICPPQGLFVPNHPLYLRHRVEDIHIAARLSVRYQLLVPRRSAVNTAFEK